MQNALLSSKLIHDHTGSISILNQTVNSVSQKLDKTMLSIEEIDQSIPPPLDEDDAEPLFPLILNPLEFGNTEQIEIMGVPKV